VRQEGRTQHTVFERIGAPLAHHDRYYVQQQAGLVRVVQHRTIRFLDVLAGGVRKVGVELDLFLGHHYVPHYTPRIGLANHEIQKM